jgi:hypothetical protein
MSLRTPATGWTAFAGVLMVILGTMNFLVGAAALSDSEFFVNNAKYILGSLNAWGWIVLGIGSVQMLAACVVLTGSPRARTTGLVFASASALVQLLFIPSQPFLALAILALDVLVIYGLVSRPAR